MAFIVLQPKIDSILRFTSIKGFRGILLCLIIFLSFENLDQSLLRSVPTCCPLALACSFMLERLAHCELRCSLSWLHYSCLCQCIFSFVLLNLSSDLKPTKWEPARGNSQLASHKLKVTELGSNSNEVFFCFVNLNLCVDTLGWETGCIGDTFGKQRMRKVLGLRGRWGYKDLHTCCFSVALSLWGFFVCLCVCPVFVSCRIGAAILILWFLLLGQLMLRMQNKNRFHVLRNFICSKRFIVRGDCTIRTVGALCASRIW